MPEFIARHRVAEIGLDRIIDTVNHEINEFGVSTVEMFYDHKTEEMYPGCAKPRGNQKSLHRCRPSLRVCCTS